MLNLWVEVLNIRDRVYVNMKDDIAINTERKQAVSCLNEKIRHDVKFQMTRRLL